MNFEFTPEQKLFAESVRRFAREHLAQGALKRAHEAGFPFDVAQLMAKQGLIGISLPEADGGQGGTLMDAVIAIMEVAAACPRSADVVQFGNFGPIRTFAEYGTPAQKARSPEPVRMTQRVSQPSRLRASNSVMMSVPHCEFIALATSGRLSVTSITCWRGWSMRSVAKFIVGRASDVGEGDDTYRPRTQRLYQKRAAVASFCIASPLQSHLSEFACRTFWGR